MTYHLTKYIFSITQNTQKYFTFILYLEKKNIFHNTKYSLIYDFYIKPSKKIFLNNRKYPIIFHFYLIP